MKQNYKLTISYDGTRYQGWEHQPGKDTVQGKLEAVLVRMLFAEGKLSKEQIERLSIPTAGIEDNSGDKDGYEKCDSYVYDWQQFYGCFEYPPAVELIGAGRTDAGVSAKAMTASVFLDTDKDPDEIRKYMNRYLPDDISVDSVNIASERFHARYNAVGKTYLYTCYAGDTKPVFKRKYVYMLDEMPDVDAMRKAAELLKGEHDFKAFCGNTKMKKSTVRVVDDITIKVSKNYIYFTFHGSGFLQHMVRILTGTLLEVGFGRLSPSDIDRIIDSCDRKLAGPTAPAKGLCLIEVDY